MSSDQTIAMIVLAVVLMVLAFRRSEQTFYEGLRASADSFLKILPLLIAVFVVVGFTPFFLPRDLIVVWLGEDSGWRHPSFCRR